MINRNITEQHCSFQNGINARFFTFATIVFFLLFPLLTTAQGDLLITPRRIVFEGSKQRQEITLANTGQDTASYSVSFVQYRMTEDGTFEQIEEPDNGQLFADPYVRYFPRTVTLAPNESQVVRMQLRRLPDMVDGEYRSHMYFRAVPDEKPLGDEDIISDTASIGIRLVPIFGITIPVIVRVGELESIVSLSNLKLNLNDENPPTFEITFNRAGNQSVFGDLTVEHITPDGKATEVGIVRGIAVYTPNPKRNFILQLQQSSDIDYTTGKLLVRYFSASEAKPEVFAEQEYLLQ